MKKAVVSVHDAETHLSKLLDRAHTDEEIVLAKAGKPYARLVPLGLEEPVEPVLGRLANRLPPIDDSGFSGKLPDEGLVAWEDGSVA